jgi:hypothetical protein
LLFAPPLALIAALAAVIDLAINRVAVRAFAQIADPMTILGWMRIGALPRNLSGVAGIVALFAALFAYLRMPGFAALYVRLPVAGFAGVLMPALTLATVLPRERMAPHLVLFGMFAAHVLICLFALAAIGYRNRGVRLALALALLTSLQVLVVITIASVRAIVAGGFGGPVAYLARHGGEVTWLLLPCAVAPTLRPPRWSSRWTLAGAAGALALALVVAAGIAGEQSLHPHYSTVMYGAFRVAALPEAASIVYVAPTAVALSAGLFGVLGPDPWRRQVGAALLLWIAGGYSPRAPVQLLDTVLAVVLLARAAQAADPEGLRRARIRWAFGRPPLPSEAPPVDAHEPRGPAEGGHPVKTPRAAPAAECAPTEGGRPVETPGPAPPSERDSAPESPGAR